MIHISRMQPFYVAEETLREWTAAVAKSFDVEEDADLELQIETEYPERKRRNKSGRYTSEVLVEGKWLDLEEVLRTRQKEEFSEGNMDDEAQH